MKSMPHICTIQNQTSDSWLPKLPENATKGQKFLRRFKKYITVSDKDPRIIEFYRTSTGLIEEKKRHLSSNYHYMIHPFSYANNLREIIMLIVYAVCFFYLPFKFCFNIAALTNTWDPGNIVVMLANIIFIVDMILRFFTGYVDKHTKGVVLNQRHVACRYVKGSLFWCDILSSVPVQLFTHLFPKSFIARFLLYLRLFRLARFATFLRCLEKLATFTQWSKSTIVTLRYLLFVLLIVHWSTCFNFAVIQLEEYVRDGKLGIYSWGNQLAGLTPIKKYFWVFWRTVGLLLCARNDQPDDFAAIATEIRENTSEPETYEKVFFTPRSEIIADMATVILGKLCTAGFGVIIISRTFEQFALDTKYQAIMSQLKEFMKNKKLPLAMRERLVQYYEHRYQKKYFKESAITAILSENIRKEVNINVCKQLVDTVQIFAELPPNVLADILSHLKQEVYLPNDIIIKSGTVGDCMYFLASGTVSVYTPSGREVCHLQDGAYFGEIALILKNTKRTTDIIAIEVCEVFRLDKKSFRSCFRYDKLGVFEKMQMIAEERLQRTVLLEESYKLELFQKAYTEKN